MSYRQSIGRWGEQLAAEYLENAGYRLVERNLHTPYGEIDLVAEQDSMLVFVEVKVRTNRRFGLPEDAVDQRKQTHLLAAAQYYISEKHDLSCDWRIDFISIERYDRHQPPSITHFENALTQ